MFVVEIPPNFDWNAADGKLLNLMLNMSAGLEYKYLSEEEKELLMKHGFVKENE